MSDKAYGAEKCRTIRDRIEELHALLAEALSIEAQIIGDEPCEKALALLETEGAPSLYIAERDLDCAINKASIVVDLLRQISRRL